MMTERLNYQDTSKGFLDGMIKTTQYLKSSSLDQKLLELVYYRVSQINGCAYCLDMHHKEALHLGESELRLYSLSVWRECPYYSEKERAVLDFAEALTYASSSELDGHTFNALTNFFTKAEIADLTLAISQINSWNRIKKTFRALPGNYKVGQHG